MRKTGARGRRGQYGSTLGIMLFLLPGMGVYLIFMLYPTIQSLLYSVIEWQGLKPIWRFQGFQNYSRLLKDPVLLIALSNNLRAWLLYAVVALPISVLLAYALGRRARGAGFFRILYYIPNVCGGSILALIWRFLYTQEYGFNYVFRSLGLGALIRPWLSADGIVQWTTNVPQTWARVGFWTVVFLAAMSSIPEELYEAAQLDGANAWQEVIHVTLPGIRSVYLSANILAVINSLNTFVFQYIMTEGGPLHRSETLMTHTLSTLFAKNNWGYGSTLAVFQFALGAIISLIIWRLARQGMQTLEGVS